MNRKGDIDTPSVTASAASLLLKCAGVLEDRNAAVRKDIHHSATYYAIDPDVITLYLRPDSSFQYMDVFGDGPRSNIVQSLAFLMGDFLFTSNEQLTQDGESRDHRFLLIPPHDEELIRLLSAFHRELLSLGGDNVERRFKALTDVFSEYERSKNDDVLLVDLRQHVPELVELFNPYLGPKAALTRFANLRDTTIQRIDTYLEEGGFAFPLLDPVCSADDRRIADELIGQWEGRLFASLRKRRLRSPEYIIRDYSVRRDAEVLATVEYVNQELRRGEEQRRLALVTGSKYLFDAASDYFPQGPGKLSFSDRYLRHPQAFLVHPRFFSQPGAQDTPGDAVGAGGRFTFRLMDWLNLFFPSKFRPAHQSLGLVRRDLLHLVLSKSRPGLDQVFEDFKKSDKDATPIATLLDGWKSQIASKANAQYADGLEQAGKRGARELAERLKALRSKREWSVERLRELVFKESLVSASKLYSTTVWMGLWRDVVREEAKGIPAPRFDDKYEVIEHYCSEVVRLQIESGSNLARERVVTLHKLCRQVENVDPSGYHIHVVHALAFATKGHWHATLTLATIAMEICRHIPEADRGFLRGREAAYLACIATRRSAQSLSDLERAGEYLEQAIGLDNPGSQEDIRFTSERLAIETRRHYFDRFCGEKGLTVGGIVATIKALQHLISDSRKESSEWVKHWVRRQSLTNCFSLLLILREMRGSNEVLGAKALRNSLADFQTVLLDKSVHDSKPEHDPYAHMICDIATAVWEINPVMRKAAKKRALEQLDRERVKLDEQKSSAAVMPYMEGRLEFLRRSITVAPTD